MENVDLKYKVTHFTRDKNDDLKYKVTRFARDKNDDLKYKVTRFARDNNDIKVAYLSNLYLIYSLQN